MMKRNHIFVCVTLAIFCCVVFQGQKAAAETTLPIAEDITLSVFLNLDSRSAATLKSYNDMMVWQEVMKRTGITLDFTSHPSNMDNEKFNLMVASGDLADLIWSAWRVAPGGPERYLQDQIIIPINDLVDQYMPNFSKILAEHPDVKLDIMTDSGTMYYFPLLRLDPATRLSDGFMIRQDWLDKLGLQRPETIAEWYTVLKAFKEQDPNGNGQADEVPLVSQQLVQEVRPRNFSHFLNAWGMTYDFYQVDGTVHFAALEPGFKEWVAEMRKWYEEGLIDPDYTAARGDQVDAKVTGDVAGAFFGWLNNNMGRYTGLMNGKHPTFKLVGTVYPVLNKGDKTYNFCSPLMSGAENTGYAISSTNKHPVETAKLLDYLYSPEGIFLLNFGIEGMTYTMEDGKPVYTEMITNSPEGWPLSQALNHYVPASVGGRVYQHLDYWMQMLPFPQQIEALAVQGQASTERLMRPITPTVEEAEELANILNEVYTYRDEMVNRMIVGTFPLEQYDDFVKTLKDMGIEKAIAIEQAALERYYQRGK